MTQLVEKINIFGRPSNFEFEVNSLTYVGMHEAINRREFEKPVQS